MTEPGPVRDREITKIRGDKPGDPITKCSDETGNCPSYIKTEESCEGCEHLAPNYKPYSTSIVHAFELWEEMKETCSILELKIADVTSGVACFWKTNERVIVDYFVGETEADAISGAWLKWKQA